MKRSSELTEFEPEDCSACSDDSASCEQCQGTGVFQQRLRPAWEPPELGPGEQLYAFLDIDHWSFVGVVNELHDTREIDYPFETHFATGNHFEALGFTVEQ